MINLCFIFPDNDVDAARILTRQFVVPFLLGIKFNLMTILPLLFAGIILLLKKAVFLSKFAVFITGLLGFGNLLSLGQFNGVNQSNRPFGGGGFGSGGFGNGVFGGGLGGNNQGGFGSLSDTFGGGGGGGGLSGGYYKSSGAPISFATTEKDPLFDDQFYNFEKKMLSNKSEKSFEKDPKLPIIEQSGRSNTNRNFVWQSS